MPFPLPVPFALVRSGNLPARLPQLRQTAVAAQSVQPEVAAAPQAVFLFPVLEALRAKGLPLTLPVSGHHGHYPFSGTATLLQADAGALHVRVSGGFAIYKTEVDLALETEGERLRIHINRPRGGSIFGISKERLDEEGHLNVLEVTPQRSVFRAPSYYDRTLKKIVPAQSLEVLYDAGKRTLELMYGNDFLTISLDGDTFGQ